MGKHNHHAVHADVLRVDHKIDHLENAGGQKKPRKSIAHQTRPDGAAPPQAPTPPKLSSVIAGIVHGVVVLMSFTSFAFMIFGNSDHEELKSVFPLAISQQVLSAFVLIGLLTFRGHFPFTMGGPTPPAALLVADVVRAAVDGVEDPEKKVATAFFVIMLVSITMGLMLLVLGLTGTAHYAQQLPYPILCGFLGSVGFLLARNAVSILIGAKLKWIFWPAQFADFEDLNVLVTLAHLFLGFAVAALLMFGVPRICALVLKRGLKKTAVLPIVFLLPMVCFFAAAGLSGMGFGAAGDLRTSRPSWLFSKVETRPFWTIWIEAYALDKWDLGAVASAIPNMLIASVLCVLAALINMAGIEANAPQAKGLNMDNEFSILGAACLVTGAVGGHPGHHVAAFTLPMKKDGGTTRFAPWTASLVWFIVFIASAPINAYVPRFFMGGVFLQVGIGLARTFLWDNRKQTDLNAKAISLLMVLVSLFTNLNYSAGIGFVIVSVNFIRQSTEVDVIRHVTRLDMHRSPKQRTMEEIRVLTTYGHKVMMLSLNGYLFWGTVDKIFEAFQELIDGAPHDPDVIYVNLEHVVGVEISVVAVFKKLHGMAKGVGINLVLCGFPHIDVLGPQLDTLLRSLPFANPKPFVDLLEESEDKLISEKGHEEQMTFIDAPCTDLELQLGEHRTHKKQLTLARYASATGSVYAVRWELLDGHLHMCQTYFSDERASFLVKNAIENQHSVESFVTKSAKVVMSVGDAQSKAVLVQSWLRQRALLCHDVLLLSDDTFPRRSIAQEYGIRRIVFLPTTDGVYEFGSTKMDQAHAALPAVHELDLPSLPECGVERFAGAVAPSYALPKLGVEPGTSQVESDFNALTFGDPAGVSAPTQANDDTIAAAPKSAEATRSNSYAEHDVGQCVEDLRKHFSWKLLLSLSTLCKEKHVSKGEQLVSDEDVGKVAEEMFIVVDGIFGTFDRHLDASLDEDAFKPENLEMKAGVGSLLGSNDVFLERPWSVKIACLSEGGRVMCLDSKVVHQLETCMSPFVDPESTHEFVKYMKRQMALQEVTLRSTVHAD